jgi:hypothetical protein
MTMVPGGSVPVTVPLASVTMPVEVSIAMLPAGTELMVGAAGALKVEGDPGCVVPRVTFWAIAIPGNANTAPTADAISFFN